MRRALALSAAAHAAALALCVLPVLLRPGSAPPAEATAEMIFVDPGGGAKAAPDQPKPEQPPPAPQAAPTPQQQANPAPTAAAEKAEGEPVPPPAPVAPPAPEATAQAAATPPRDTEQSPPPSVRLGDEDGAGSTDEVRSEQMAVGPDPSAPNVPPRYPAAAARRGQQGTVMLEVIVAPDGQAQDVIVYATSGFPMLDQAAQGAVSRWRFTPKMDHGAAVPARTLIRVSFKLD